MTSNAEMLNKATLGHGGVAWLMRVLMGADLEGGSE
jgi:hypothetical protein